MSSYTRLETPANIRGDLTSTGRSLLLDWIVGGHEIPKTIWLGMSVQQLGDSTTAADLGEVASSYSWKPNPYDMAVDKRTNYERQPYPFNAGPQGTGWYSNTGGYYFNVSKIEFPAIPDDGYWPKVVSWFIATEAKNGDIIAYGPVGDLPASPGDRIIIPSGSLSLRVAPLRVS